MTAEEKNHDHFSQVNQRLVSTKIYLSNWIAIIQVFPTKLQRTLVIYSDALLTVLS